MDWWIEDGWLAEERPAVCLARSDYKEWPLLEQTAMGGGWLVVGGAVCGNEFDC